MVVQTLPVPQREQDAQKKAADAADAAPVTPATAGALEKVKEIIAEQTGYTTDMLEDTLDLEADLALTPLNRWKSLPRLPLILGFPVPEDLKLRDLNTIARAGRLHQHQGHSQGPDTPKVVVQTLPFPQRERMHKKKLRMPQMQHPLPQPRQVPWKMVKEIIAEQTGYTSDYAGRYTGPGGGSGH